MNEWPWQYDFPPFFTIQVHAETRKMQLEAWRQLVLDYCRNFKQHIIDISNTSTTPLFNNKAINHIRFNLRQGSLSPEDVLVIMEYLSQSENAEPCDKEKRRWYVYWHPLKTLAAQIEDWVRRSGLENSVCTFYEMVNSSEEELNGIHEDVLIKALRILESESKAQLIMSDGNNGVKFLV